MSRPLLLDLFCGAGGAAMGYHRAGFDVVGVDIEPQPRYPFDFVRDDALAFLGREVAWRFECRFVAVHASPPCQRYCAPSQYNGNRDEYPDLVDPTRALLLALGLPYIIENTPGAPLVDPIVLCGQTFGLPIYRHRLFESSEPITPLAHSTHERRCSRNGVIPTEARPFMTITGGKHSKAWTRAAAQAMGVEWMQTTREVCEAIPPAYTEHIGRQLLTHTLMRKVA